MIRTGQGWDLHRLIEGRPLILGGITLPSNKGEDAHSDGDVLIHAIIDALLGALALGDIGDHFPPSDNQWKDADSTILLKQVYSLVRKKGYAISNLDCTIILEKPKLGEYKEKIRNKLAELLELNRDQVSVKAKSSEKVGPVGRNEAVEALAAVLMYD